MIVKVGDVIETVRAESDHNVGDRFIVTEVFSCGERNGDCSRVKMTRLDGTKFRNGPDTHTLDTYFKLVQAPPTEEELKSAQPFPSLDMFDTFFGGMFP